MNSNTILLSTVFLTFTAVQSFSLNTRADDTSEAENQDPYAGRRKIPGLIPDKPQPKERPQPREHTPAQLVLAAKTLLQKKQDARKEECKKFPDRCAKYAGGTRDFYQRQHGKFILEPPKGHNDNCKPIPKPCPKGMMCAQVMIPNPNCGISIPTLPQNPPSKKCVEWESCPKGSICPAIAKCLKYE